MGIKIRKVIRSMDQDGSNKTYQYHFVCPGCNCEHAFDYRWTFNQDFEKPTIKPSFLQQGFIGFKNEEPRYGTCHSFIKDGMIQYLNDCSHELKGQTVELLDITDDFIKLPQE